MTLDQSSTDLTSTPYEHVVTFIMAPSNFVEFSVSVLMPLGCTQYVKLHSFSKILCVYFLTYDGSYSTEDTEIRVDTNVVTSVSFSECFFTLS